MVRIAHSNIICDELTVEGCPLDEICYCETDYHCILAPAFDILSLMVSAVSACDKAIEKQKQLEEATNSLFACLDSPMREKTRD